MLVGKYSVNLSQTTSQGEVLGCASGTDGSGTDVWQPSHKRTCQGTFRDSPKQGWQPSEISQVDIG